MDMKKAKDNGQAVLEFMVAVNAISDKLELLSEYMDDHMGVSPEEIHWGHVGSANHILEKLNEIIEFAGIEK